ncbi:Carbamoylphosphate synthase large subunit (split gene in MJ) [Olavius sp. associated proteobacterium Delta 1]|nr:Carbamoylphosphate synthase large subunit (split gene in MJ) [Olavius sp. associated proteobacterium Delta 1]
MNIVFLSPHFPPHYFRFCLNLKAAGANVLGVGEEPYDNLSQEVRSALTEYYQVDDMHDYDALVRACGFFTHRYGKIDRLDSLNEYWLSTEAGLRDDFNIFGVRGTEIDFIRRKSRMKDKFQEAGVPVARGQVVRTMDDAQALIRETGYPVIAKPDDGVGAIATYRLESNQDLADFFETKSDTEYIMEEFISGTIFSFDGLADRNGNPVFYTVHTFSQGIMETVNDARHIYYYSLRDIPTSLEKIGCECLKAFKVKERFFHIEFFKTAPDKYVALEVNMRPPGGYTTDMFNFACNIDIYHAWAELLVHSRTELNYTRDYHCCYASRKFNRRYVQRHEEILSRFGKFIVQIESVPGVFSSALGDIGYMFRSESLAEIMEIVQFIHQTE